MKNLLKVSVAALLVAAPLSLAAADAKANWEKHCAKCHGMDGKGQTKMGRQSGAKDYTDPKVQGEFTDEQGIKAVKEGLKVNGKEAMKPIGDKLTDPEIKDLIGYIRTFKK